MEIGHLMQANLLSPMILAFVLGITAARLRSDLRVPEALYTGLSIYLLLAIGMRGGAELSHTSFLHFWKPGLATLLLGISVPIWCYVILRRLGKFDNVNAAAIAAHYGSVSAVTFIASLSFLDSVKVPYEGFLPTLVALLEVPAILVALLIARSQMPNSNSLSQALREILTGKTVLLLIGGLLIGFLAGQKGMEQVKPFFVDPYKGVLTLFLLEMGIVTGQRLGELRKVGVFLLCFGILMPLLHGLLGVTVGTWAGLSLGGSMVLGAMVASASYIAAPAAVRIVLPEANPSLYLTAALAITFPFNLAFGIPLYYTVAQLLHHV